MKKMIYAGAMLVLAMCASNMFAQGAMNSNDKMKMSGKKNADSNFMMMAATGGMNEIALSKQALAKSSNDDVKQFAQMMVDDHTKAGDELKSVAETKNVVLPTTADAKHQAAVAKMESLSGAAFDAAYLKMMVSDHEKTVALFQKEVNTGKDNESKGFATGNLPIIEGHLKAARDLMAKMTGGKTASQMSGK